MLRITGKLSILALDGADRSSFLNYNFAESLVWQAECLHTRIIAKVKLSVNHRSYPKAGAESVTQQI